MCNRAVLDCTPKRRWIASGEQAPIMQMTCRWRITSNLADWAAASLEDVWVRTLPRPDVRYFGHAGCPGADYHRASADLLRRVVKGGWRTIARWFGDTPPSPAASFTRCRRPPNAPRFRDAHCVVAALRQDGAVGADPFRRVFPFDAFVSARFFGKEHVQGISPAAGQLLPIPFLVQRSRQRNSTERSSVA